MSKKILAFYDLLIYVLICGPLFVCSALIFLFGDLNDLNWTLTHFHLVVLFAIGIVFPFIGTIFLRYLKIGNGSVHFHYAIFIRTLDWRKVNDNIDVRWNTNMFLSEIKDVEVVKLTEEEKAEKVFYKHWFNKYLKVDFYYGNPKYVYVGNYSSFQIKKIIKLLISD